MGVVTLLLLLGLFARVNEAQLSFGYYETSCPNVETIVKNAITPIFFMDITAPAAFLRLMFHDCQVQGCDASILLDSDDQNIDSEMASTRNFNVKKRESIGQIKSVLESVCPGQVSCADIIALAARESVSFTGGPQIQIPLGRKDSISANREGADMHLPPPDTTVDEMLQIYTSKGMNLEESVAIMGAHTLGVGHCLTIVGRLYDPKRVAAGTNDLDKGYEIMLKLTCPTNAPLTNLAFVPNDITPVKFDNQYFRDILNGRGLFGIDSNIARDPRTVPIVKIFAEDQSYFFQVFDSALVKLSLANVLTGEAGQIRRDCSRLN